MDTSEQEERERAAAESAERRRLAALGPEWAWVGDLDAVVTGYAEAAREAASMPEAEVQARWRAALSEADRVLGPVRVPTQRQRAVDERQRGARLVRRPGIGAQALTLEVWAPVDLVHSLPVLAAAVGQVEAILAERAREAAAEQSWAAVGRALGISRQSARQRFGTSA